MKREPDLSARASGASSSRVTEYDVSQRLRLARVAPSSAGRPAYSSSGVTPLRARPRIACSEKMPETTIRASRAETSR